MVYKNTPISLQQEEDNKINLKKIVNNLFSVKNKIEEQEVVEDDKIEISLEQQLEQQFKPYLESKKYNQNELNIIKKHLFNELSNAKPQDEINVESTDKIIPPPKDKYISSLIQRLEKTGNKGFLELDQSSFLNFSNYSKSVPTQSNNVSYYEDNIFDEFTYDDYQDALLERGKNENKQSNKLGYMRVYTDEIYGLDSLNEYVEIDGIRRSIGDDGMYKYEVYNILDFEGEDGQPLVGENLQLASQEQIDNFKDKLLESEYDLKLNQEILKNSDYNNDPNLLASADPSFSFAATDDVADTDEDIVLDDEEDDMLKVDLDEIEVTAKTKIEKALDEYPDSTKETFNKAFELKFGKDGKPYLQLREYPTDLTEAGVLEYLKQTFGTELTVKQMYTGVGKRELAVIVGLADGVQLPVYGQYGRDYTIEDHDSTHANNTVINLQQQIKTLYFEANKQLDNIVEEIDNEIVDVHAKKFESFVKENMLYYSEDEYFFNPSVLGTKEDVQKMIDMFEDAGIQINKDDFELRVANVDGERKYTYAMSYETIAEYYSATFNNMREKDPRYAQVVADTNKTIKEAVKNLKSTYKPEWKLIDDFQVNQIKEYMKVSNFETADTYNKRLILDNMWEILSQELNVRFLAMEPNPSIDQRRDHAKIVEKMKEEYYYMMYSPSFGNLAWEIVPGLKATEEHVKAGLADKVGGDVRTWSLYALKDFARNLMDPTVHDIGGKLLKAKKGSDEYKKLKMLRDFAIEIDQLDEGLINGENPGIQALLQGLTKNDVGGSLPFISKINNIFDQSLINEASTRIMNEQKINLFLAKKDEGTLQENEKKELEELLKKPRPTQDDMLLMSMHSVHGMLQGKLENNFWYNTGGIISDMFPYILEFAITSPIYGVARSGSMNFLKSIGMTGPVSARIGNVMSFLFSSSAQTAANPQMIISSALQNMSPEIQMSMKLHDDEFTIVDGEKIEGNLISIIDNNTLKEQYIERDGEKIKLEDIKEGKIYKANNGKRFEFVPQWTGKDPMPLETAYFRAFGTSWAEMGTERMGAAFLPILKKMDVLGLSNNVRGLKELTESIILSKLMKSEKFVKWRQGKKFKNSKAALAKYIVANNLGWNGLLQEVGEETLNQPITSLIMGREWNEAFVDEQGNFDPTFFKEMATSMGIVQLGFSGTQYYKVMKKNKK